MELPAASFPVSRHSSHPAPSHLASTPNVTAHRKIRHACTRGRERTLAGSSAPWEREPRLYSTVRRSRGPRCRGAQGRLKRHAHSSMASSEVWTGAGGWGRGVVGAVSSCAGHAAECRGSRDAGAACDSPAVHAADIERGEAAGRLLVAHDTGLQALPRACSASSSTGPEDPAGRHPIHSSLPPSRLVWHGGTYQVLPASSKPRARVSR